jgi:uncharacterized protein YndB with AHSA1/START domain
MHNIEQLNYINAPLTAVYQALTTSEGLAEVWTKKLEVKPEVGFVNTFDFDEGYLTRMKITELTPDKRVVWECIASDAEWVGTTITFELSEENNKTAVILKHSSWRELTDFYRWCGYNWAIFLFSLKTYCENQKGLPYQERSF